MTYKFNQEATLDLLYNNTAQDRTFNALTNKPNRLRHVSYFAMQRQSKWEKSQNLTAYQILVGPPIMYDGISCKSGQMYPHYLDDISGLHDTAITALDYAIDLANFIHSRKLKLKHEIVNTLMRRDLPYQVCTHLLNRHYNPVGSNLGSKWSTHEDYPNLCTTINNMHAKAYNLKLLNGFNIDHRNYLFDDRNCPWRSHTDLKTYIIRLTNLRNKI